MSKIIKTTLNHTPTEEQLEKINRFSQKELSAAEVYVFSAVLCDNEIDRDFECFTTESLKTLEQLFVGKTGIFDHSFKTTDQFARIFDCHLEITENKNSLGENYARLVASAYIPKGDFSADIISQIESGIKKEVSIGCAVSQKTCSVCHKNITDPECRHLPGCEYSVNGALKTCFVTLENPVDAYEFSFVAVPSQRSAGVTKNLQSGKTNPVEEMVRSDTAKQISVVFNHSDPALFDAMVKTLSADELCRLKSVLQAKFSVEQSQLFNFETNTEKDDLSSFKL